MNSKPDIENLISNSLASSINQLPTQAVPLSSLRYGGSPRLSGHDRAHVDVLAQAEGRLPPILVHRPTMRIIDGVHRAKAARRRGDHKIEVCFFDGEEKAAFVLGVQANISHGLPLTLADRTSAAARILASYPDWSDRAIARVSGLNNGTVSAIRRRATVDSAQSNTRLGRDGRMRPLNSAEGRRRAAELIAKKPGLSLREISREAGISIATVRDVRHRLAQGQDPLPPKLRGVTQNPRPLRKPAPSDSFAAECDRLNRAPEMILAILRKDPSIRSSEPGRALLKWLTTHAAIADNWKESIDLLPPHSNGMVLEVARGFAQTWSRFADELEHRMEPNSE